MELTPIDRVWNRACGEPGGARVGDRHLRALLRVHNVIMSGGPNHAADVCSPKEIAAAAAASVYYGLAGLDNVIRRLPDAAADEEAELDVDEAYHRLVPNDDALDRAFQRKFVESPSDFEPLT
jgi:hypothetical protein